MDNIVIQALCEDIENWESIATKRKLLTSVNVTCFATYEVNNASRDCDKCVIKKYTGRDECFGTPKQRYYGPNEDEAQHHADFLKYILFMETNKTYKETTKNKN